MKYIIDAFVTLLGITLIGTAFCSFVFMWFVFYNGYIFAGLFLLVVSVLSYAGAEWLVENSWRIRWLGIGR